MQPLILTAGLHYSVAGHTELDALASKTLKHAPEAASHSRTVLSRDALAKSRRPPESATPSTASRCPCMHGRHASITGRPHACMHMCAQCEKPTEHTA